MKPVFKPGQRVRYRDLRGTILMVFGPTPKESARVLRAGGFGDRVQTVTEYTVALDNGVTGLGTRHQFSPIRRS